MCCDITEHLPWPGNEMPSICKVLEELSSIVLLLNVSTWRAFSLSLIPALCTLHSRVPTGAIAGDD